jgi:hypothetical protein
MNEHDTPSAQPDPDESTENPRPAATSVLATLLIHLAFLAVLGPECQERATEGESSQNSCGAADEAQQLAIIGQLAHLAGRIAPEQLARRALQGWASPHAAVRAATCWRVRGIAERDGAWGAYFLRRADHEALHNRRFLAHLPNPGDVPGWIQAMTHDARAYEHWRQGGVPQAAA